MKTIDALVEGGNAKPMPPLGPALAAAKLNVGQVIQEINKATASFKGLKVPVKIKYDPDTKEFNIEVGLPPVSQLLKVEAKIEKGGGTPEMVADLPLSAVIKVAKTIRDKSLGKTLKETTKEVLGTCLSMRLSVEGKNPREIIREIDEGKHDSLFG